MEKTLSRRKKGTPRTFLRSVLLSLLITVPVLFFLLLLSCAVALRSEDPNALIPPLGNGCALLSSLLCGFLAAKLRGRQGLLIGAAAGLGYLVLFLIGLATQLGDGTLNIGMLLFSYLIFFSLSVLGGVLGTLKRERKHRRRSSR